MPEHGAVKRKIGDKVYVYYATAIYRNEKGQPAFVFILVKHNHTCNQM